MTLRRLMVAASALLIACSVGCSTNPATGQSQLNMISTSREISIGNEAAPNFLRDYGGPIPSPQINSYVSDLGQRLAAESERPDLPWEFHAVDSSVINAFALPGGKVFITRGLMNKMNNEAQLAGVLGHEVGHVTAQHIGQRMTQATILQGVIVGLGMAGQVSDEEWLSVLGVGAQVGGSVYLLQYGRSHEHQADELGLRYMTRLGYNPVAQIQVMQILADASGGGRPPEFLSTHPYPESRIERLESIIHEQYPDFENPAKYKFAQDRFEREVLDRFEDLPPAKHTGEQSAALAPPCSCPEPHDHFLATAR